MKKYYQAIKVSFFILIILGMVGVLCFPTQEVAAQSVEDGFNPNSNSSIRAIVVQPDGKILVGGIFSNIGGQPRNRVARLHPDGSLDISFDPDSNGFLWAIALQSDNKILIGGNFTKIGGVDQAYLARLHPNGSLDTDFNPVVNGLVVSLVIQPDGKILAGGHFSEVNGHNRSGIARLNINGSLDMAFNPVITDPYTTSVHSIALQPDGKILIGGSFTQVQGQSRNRIARLNTDGLLDTKFNPGAGASNLVLSIAVQSDGHILVGGQFTHMAGEERPYLVRLNYDGSLDPYFTPPIFASSIDFVRILILQPDGKILVGGWFSELSGVPRNKLARLNPDGGIDMGFNPNVDNMVETLALQSDGKILIGGNFSHVGGIARDSIARLYTDGSLDTTINLGANGNVTTIAVQPDGKILVGGNFTTFGGQTRQKIARLHPDGTLDTSFTTVVNDNLVFVIAIQPDGKILIGGSFTQVQGQSRNGVARLNPDGSLDPGFNPNTNGTVYTLAQQPDGRILMGGTFTQIGGTTRERIARVDTSGTLDPTFTPFVMSSVRHILIQPDGKILLAGEFTAIDWQTQNRIARLNVDGSLDPGFNAGTGANNHVNTLALQADGKILIGGNFTQVDNTTRFHLARLNTNGSLDTQFDPGPDRYVSTLAVQTDGKILVGGDFSIIDRLDRNCLARLLSNGHLDLGFTTQVNPTAGGNVNALTVQPDGKILVGGSFLEIGGVRRNRFARVSTTQPAFQSLNATHSRITWTRKWAGPELQRVAFDYSTDGINFTHLGAGSRIADGWQSRQVSLPTGINLVVRALGFYSDANSESLVESVRQVIFGPTMFSKTYPIENQVNVSITPILSWGNSTGVVHYEYCIGIDPDEGDCDVIDWTSTGESQSVEVPSLSHQHTYSWQVRAINPNGITYANNGIWWSFTTKGIPPEGFSKISPVDGAINVSRSPTLTWASSAGAVRYEYCLGSDLEDADCDVIDWTSVGLSQSVTVSGLSQHHTYGWQVRAINDDGETYANDSTWWSFTTIDSESDRPTIFLPLIMR